MVGMHFSILTFLVADLTHSTMNEDGNSGNSNISVCDEHYVVPLNATEYLNDQESSVWDYHTRFEFVVHGILICVVGLLGLLGV